MRFYTDGPSLPRPLLAAADAGDVVFVCGAGVSLARAGLPTFQGLLDGVVGRLRPAPDGLAAQVLAAEERLRVADPPIALPPGFSGIATADGVFGLLEEEFGTEAVERLVADVLKPASDPDLSAHRTVLRLARGPYDAPRLVTTNFDRLFEMAAPDLPVHLPPKFDPDAHGIVKLHGSISTTGEGPEGDSFVLSGAAFGGAYVADGWAARTMRALMERHTVVFLGYAADDPPMQYLLEGLKRIGAPITRAYAFQPGEDAARRWAARGVTAIHYDAHNYDHTALWATLEAWADRVTDPPKWRNAVVDMARRGPRDLTPSERGQVADILSTTAGAQTFAETDDPPPAEWVCVLDRRARYGRPGCEAPYRFRPDEPMLDPFALYGLDGDPIVDVDPASNPPKRDVPEDAWDGLAWTEDDHNELRAQGEQGGETGSRGGLVATEGMLPPRLNAIEWWMASVATEPAALWWWVRRGPPRHRFERMLTHARRSAGGPTDAWIAWDRLLECHAGGGSSESSDRPLGGEYDFRDDAFAIGWMDTILRRFEDLARPRLCLSQDFSAVPPRREAGVSRLAMVGLNLDYREAFWRMVVPDDALPAVVVALGRQLVRFTALQNAHPHIDLYRIPPFARPDDPTVSDHQYTDGLGGIVFGYCAKLDALMGQDPDAFDREVASWPHGPALFDRLRLWLALDPARCDGATVAAILDALPGEMLWRSDSRRDALHVIRYRWSDLDGAQRAGIARRLARGPDQSEPHWVEPERRQAVSAWQRLDAIGWLVREGVDVGLDWDALREEWRDLVPDWDENGVDEAVEAHVSRGGVVQTDTDHDVLSGVPLEDVVATAMERSGRSGTFLVEADPFLGLVQDDPGRAREAIRQSTADATMRGKALHKLLNAAAGAADRHPVNDVLSLLEDCPNGVLAEAAWAVGHWVKTTSGDRDVVPCLDALLDRFTGILPNVDWPADTDAEPDHVFRAINAPAGQIVEAMTADPRLPNAERRTGLPDAWRARAQTLLALPRPHGDHTLTIFSGQAPYLHAHAPDWVEAHLLPHLDGPSGSVFLAGLGMWRHELAPRFFGLIRPALIAAAEERGGGGRSRGDWVSGQLFFAWMRNDGSLPDDAFADVLRRGPETVRLAVLSYVRSMTKTPRDDTVHGRVAYLLNAVWPRQAALQTEAVMIYLVDVALAGGDDLPRLSAAAMPHLRQLPAWPELYRFRHLDTAAVHYPSEVLALLDRITPENATRPVYGLDKIIEAIITADPSLHDDPRIEKLRRAAG